MPRNHMQGKSATPSMAACFKCLVDDTFSCCIVSLHSHVQNVCNALSTILLLHLGHIGDTCGYASLTLALGHVDAGIPESKILDLGPPRGRDS